MNIRFYIDFICIECNSYLDFEQIFFENSCEYCASSQGYDIQDFGGLRVW